MHCRNQSKLNIWSQVRVLCVGGRDLSQWRLTQGRWEEKIKSQMRVHSLSNRGVFSWNQVIMCVSVVDFPGKISPAEWQAIAYSNLRNILHVLCGFWRALRAFREAAHPNGSFHRPRCEEWCPVSQETSFQRMLSFTNGLFIWHIARLLKPLSCSYSAGTWEIAKWVLYHAVSGDIGVHWSRVWYPLPAL